MASYAERYYPKAAEIGARLRYWRERQGLKIVEVAKRSGFTQQQISSVELGKVNTPYETLVKLAEALSVSLEVLVARSTPPMMGGFTTPEIERIVLWAVEERPFCITTLRSMAHRLETMPMA